MDRRKLYPKRINRMQKWLNSKVNDCTIKSKYDYHKDTLDPYLKKYENIKIFRNYYKENNDTDILNSDQSYLFIINEEKKHNFEEFKNDEFLLFLDHHVERYRSEDGEKEKQILIPPNTNRYHTNYLFKMLVDCSDFFELTTNIYNPKTREIELIPLIDTDFKDIFYEFCYNNTYKDRKIR